MYTADVLKITFLNPGVSYEKSIAKSQTLYGQVFMNTSGYFSYSSSRGYSSKFYFDPALTIQYRFYYNGKRRLKKGKRIEMNSMNYLTALFEGVLSKRPFATGVEDIKRRTISSFGLAWGFQRNYKRRFSFDMHLGLATYFGKSVVRTYPQIIRENTSQLSFASQINIGIWLNKKE